MILAIGAQDDFLHVYHDAQELLGDHKIGAGEEERCGPLEFFDSAGYRLAGTYSPTWQLQGLTRTADSADPTQLRQRVQSCIDHLRSYIKNHPEKVESYEMTVDEALARCPDLNGSSDFENCLRALAHSGSHHKEGELGTEHRTDDYWHNLVHGSGWQD